MASAVPMDCLRVSSALSRAATARCVRRAVCWAPSSWRAAEMNWATWADRSAESCMRTEAWDMTACGLFDVSRAPMEDMLPFSYAVDAIAATWARMDWKLARSVLTSRVTRASRWLALASSCAAWS